MTLKPAYFFKLYKEGKYLLFINVIEQFFFFLVFLVFARKYSVETYGELITLFTLANVFITLFNFGFPVFLQREIAISKDKSSMLLSRIFSINILIFFLYFLLTFVYYRLFYNTISLKLFLVTILPVYLYSNINILNSVLSGLSEYKKQFKSFINSRIITVLAFLIFALVLNSKLTYLLIIYSIGFLYHITLLIYNIKKITGSFFLSFNFTGISGLIKVSLPLGMAVIFNYLYDKIDILLISEFTDYSRVGYYNIGYGIYKASAIAFSFLLISGLTKVSYLSRSSYAVKLFFRKYSSSLILIGIIINIFLFLASEYIIKIIYTDKFTDSILILRIVSFAVVGLALNNLAGVTLNGLGLYRENMYVTLTGLIVNIVLNLIFIPLYGIIAAAIISVFTEYFIFCGDYYFIKRFINPE
ncbi:MAG: oligosaccharide flippase family protein [Ignavibacteria bacterium]|jgi:O-antigen/teichoic acid export membrane protein